MKIIYKKSTIAGAIIIALVLFAIVFLPINTWLMNYLAISDSLEGDYDIAIVLGAGIQKQGSLTEMAQERVDHALVIYRESDLPLFFSGGQTPAGVESMVMYSYAKAAGYNGPQYIESESESTYQNAILSAEQLLEENILSDTILLVTSPHHAKRALATFKKAMPQKELRISFPEQTVILDNTPWGKIKGFKSLIREFLALLFYKVRYQVST